MYILKRLLSLACVAATVSAQVIKGFNYGSTNSAGGCYEYSDYVSLFNLAKSLPNASGFSSARLYTMIQCGTTNTPISAIQAALDTDTTLLLGLWASAGQEGIDNEIAALTAAASQFGSSLSSNVIGISVGSEDLYRNSAQGMANNAGIGATASTVTSYISQVKSAIQGTALENNAVGHVDTWTAWILPDTAPVIAACDFLGHNSFPYFENTLANSIQNGYSVFNNALENTESVSEGKPVWVTETGWPVSGATENQAVPSIQNAQTYWDAVGCELFGNRSTWWYTLQDANPNQNTIAFGLVPLGSSTPLYDLSC